MKTKKSTDAVRKNFLTVVMALALFATGYSQQQTTLPTLAILNIESKGVILDAPAISYLVRLELEKTGKYSIMDRHDVADFVKKSGIDMNTCYGKTCVESAGELLGVDKMITGSVERFAEKIVITLRLIDVKSKTVEKTNATEYLNLQPELQKMVEVSIKRLVGIEPDKNMVNLLVDYDVPIQSPKTTLKLNGPRMGASLTTGYAGDKMSARRDEGGFNMYPLNFQIGWQQEYQYLSAGDFQALIEGIVMVGGLESGKFIPSFTFLNGFRESKSGWEFAFGPTFRFVQKAYGFFDTGNLMGDGKDKWHLEEEWNSSNPNLMDTVNGYPQLTKNPYPIDHQIDSRGDVTLSAGLLLAVGKTFKSGYLNIPVNLYVSPRKEGWIAGASFGFNVNKKRRVE